jgi:hypothetical protein
MGLMHLIDCLKTLPQALALLKRDAEALLLASTVRRRELKRPHQDIDTHVSMLQILQLQRTMQRRSHR